MNKDQLTLSDLEIQKMQAEIKSVYAELDRLWKSAAFSMKRDDFATLIDKTYSYVSDVLNTNNEEGQKPFTPLMMAAVIVARPEKFMEVIGTYLCEKCGYDFPEKSRDLTPEEELGILKRKIREHGLDKLFEDLSHAPRRKK